MILKTLKSKIFRELRWLKASRKEDKIDELWNIIAELTEQMHNLNIPPGDSYFTFTRHSSGISRSIPKDLGGRFKLIATIKPWEYPQFRELWDTEYSTHQQQEEALMPILKNVYEQVYGENT